MSKEYLFFSKTPITWGDGLPTVAPTLSRVKKIMGSDWKKRNKLYSEIESLNINFTYAQLAANAVMAGCNHNSWNTYKACIDAILDKRFNIETVITTVHSQSPLILISGNEARKLMIDGGRGSIGPGKGQSTAIGRAVYLFMRNICNGTPELLDAATFGHLGKMSFCFSENIQLNPWKEFHIQKGFTEEQSTVTVFSSQSPHEIVEMGEKDTKTLIDALVYTLLNPFTYNAFYNQDVWLLFSPEHANRLKNGGLLPNDIKQILYEKCVFKKSQLKNKGLYGFIEKELKDSINLFKSPNNINIAVTGGSPGGYSMVCFGSGLSITKEIKK